MFLALMDVDALGSRRRSGYAREGVPSIVGGDRNIGVIDSGGLSCLVEYPIEVIVTIVDERHGVGQHIMVGEYDFHRRRLADSRPVHRQILHPSTVVPTNSQRSPP